MKERIQGYRRRSVVTFFGVVYLLTLFLAMYPPLYQWRSTVEFDIGGVPFATMYWLVDALVLTLGLWAFYKVSELRGELDDDLLTPPAHNMHS